MAALSTRAQKLEYSIIKIIKNANFCDFILELSS